MPAGDLSGEQHQYLYALTGGTGLDRHVGTAWIGAESGWNTTKDDHNYLNTGSGERFHSAIEAGRRAVGLIRKSDHYAGIREAIKSGDPDAQIEAIIESPWDEGHYGGDGHELRDVYEQVKGGTSWTDKTPGELIGEGTEAAVRSAIGGGIWEDILVVSLTVVFTVGGLVLVVVGLLNLLGFTPKEAIDTAVPG